MPRRSRGRRRNTRSKKRRFVTRARRLAPAPREKRIPFTGLFDVTVPDPAGNPAYGTYAHMIQNRENSKDAMLVGINGTCAIGCYMAMNGAARGVDVVVALCTPFRDAVADNVTATFSAFNPFDDSNWQLPAEVRGFNVVRFRRLAFSQPGAAAGMLHTRNLRLTRRFKRFLTANRNAHLVVWVQGAKDVRLSLQYDASLKYVVTA